MQGDMGASGRAEREEGEGTSADKTGGRLDGIWQKGWVEKTASA